MKFGVKSDRGIVRSINEDSYNIIAGYPNLPVCFIIADGMGGHNAGEVASQMAVDSVSKAIMEFPGDLFDEDAAQGKIREIMKNANADVYKLSNEQTEKHGMGTTLILSVVCKKKLFIGHIGDSRAYVIRDGMMEQITTDHSFIEELIKNGSITRQEAQKHPQRNIITRALGCSEEVEIDTFSCNIKENDIFLMCTDGLTNMVNEDRIKVIVTAFEDMDQACAELVNEANSNGGEDNITVIAFKVS